MIREKGLCCSQLPQVPLGGKRAASWRSDGVDLGQQAKGPRPARCMAYIAITVQASGKPHSPSDSLQAPTEFTSSAPEFLWQGAALPGQSVSSIVKLKSPCTAARQRG